MPVDVDAAIAAMSLEEQIGQLIAGRIPGATLDEESAARFRECHLGGVVLFAHNLGSPEETASLTAALQDLCGRPGFPAIIAVDQEGGRVERLHAPATTFPSAMAFGAAADPDLVRRRGVAVARELRAVGINYNFAPVLDVNNNPANPVIGARSFGARADEVGRLGVAAIEGLRLGGVGSSVKHFPGHGDTGVDSHFDLPTVPYDLDRLQAVELAPFKAAIAAGAPAIMSSHILFPALDPDLPCTLSRRILTDFLRGELGFTGLIISDAMNMDAITERWGIVDGSVRFIAAGGDLVEPLREERAIHAALVAAVREGRIPEQQIVDSVRRVMQLRAWLDAQGPADPAWYGASEHRALSAEVARRAITLLRDDAGLVPLPRDRRLAVIECFHQWRFRSVAELPPESRLAAALRPHFREVRGVVLHGQEPAAEGLEAARHAAEWSDVVVLGTRGTNRFPRQAEFVTAAQGWERPIVAVALADPYDTLAYLAIPTALATYGADTAMLAALADVLTGAAQAVGVLPVTL